VDAIDEDLSSNGLLEEDGELRGDMTGGAAAEDLGGASLAEQPLLLDEVLQQLVSGVVSNGCHNNHHNCITQV
jgi:hypothetical protein